MDKKIALVTGGSSGLGFAMAEELKNQGFFVVIIARNKGENFNFDDFISCDLSDSASRRNLIQTIQEKYPAIDILINNAGIGSYAANYELEISDLKRLMEINYFAPVELNSKLLDNVAQAKGTIVNISSVAGLMPVACMGAYCSSKAALFMHSESLRMEVGAKNVHILTVCPGRINTGFSSRAIRVRECPDTPSNKNESAALLAKKIYRAICRKKDILIFPWWYSAVVWFTRKYKRLYRYGNKRVWKLD